MATKDWKKMGKDFWRDAKRKNNLKSSIKISAVKVPISILGTAERKEYKVSFGNYKADIENYASWFKTKQKAFAYAKAYMRKH